MGGADDPPAGGEELLDAVGAPAHHPGHGEERGVELHGDAHHLVHEAGEEVHVGADHLPLPVGGHDTGGEPLHRLIELELVQHPLALGQSLGVLFQQDGPGIGEGVDGVAHAVDEPRAVPGLLIHEPAQVGGDLLLVGPIPDPILNVLEHLHDLLVGAAVAWALQGADGPGDGGVQVGPGGGEHPAGKGGVVAAAVLGVDDHAQVQELCLLGGKFVVVPHRPEEIFRHGQPRLGTVEVEAFVVVVVPFGGVGVGHDLGGPGHQDHGSPQFAGKRHVLGVIIVGVEGEHRPAQFVHHVGAGGLQDHVLGEHGRQVVVGLHEGLKVRQPLLGGQGAEEEQVGGLGVAEAALGGKALDELGHVDAPVDELAGHGHPLPVLDVVAPDVGDLSDPGHHAGAVGVAQAPLDLPLVVGGRVDAVVFTVLLAQPLQEAGGYGGSLHVGTLPCPYKLKIIVLQNVGRVNWRS